MPWLPVLEAADDTVAFGKWGISAQVPIWVLPDTGGLVSSKLCSPRNSVWRDGSYLYRVWERSSGRWSITGFVLHVWWYCVLHTTIQVHFGTLLLVDQCWYSRWYTTTKSAGTRAMVPGNFCATGTTAQLFSVESRSPLSNSQRVGNWYQSTLGSGITHSPGLQSS